MPSKIEVYDLLISCPSDVSDFVDIIEKEVNHFNNYYGRTNNVIIRTRHWSKDSFSEAGGNPQEILNKQIVDSSDMAIGVFWTRFGLPTENYGSGTEEEISRMIETKKQVFLFFLDKEICPSELDFDQYQKVKTFREKYQNKGIYFVVKDEKALATKFRENLELYFDSVTRSSEFISKCKNKVILWVDDRPENNTFERNTLEHYGLEFTLALSTDQALRLMEYNDYALIISDMGRKEGSREGYVLLEEVRKRNHKIPFIIYAGSREPEHIREAKMKGSQGCTNRPGELIDLVIKNLLKS